MEIVCAFEAKPHIPAGSASIQAGIHLATLSGELAIRTTLPTLSVTMYA